MNQSTERLDKFLSNRGVSSRRNIKIFLKENTVTINNNRIRESGFRFNPDTDSVLINGKKLQTSSLVYFALNKPIGIISTSSDEYGRKNVVSLIQTPFRIYPVGRLDKDTSGLILLTNDGELTHKATHPKFHVPKVYRLTIHGKISNEQIKSFKNGVLLRDGITNNAEIRVITENKETSLLEVILHEGRYRQIRRMCEALGINLKALMRIKFGPIDLGKLSSGEFRELSQKDVKALRRAVGLT